jgi:hypothetical protein
LLPIKHQAGIFVTRLQVCERSKGRDQLDVARGLVTSEDLNNAIGRTSHEEGLVILVYQAHFGYL